TMRIAEAFLAVAIASLVVRKGNAAHWVILGLASAVVGLFVCLKFEPEFLYAGTESYLLSSHLVGLLYCGLLLAWLLPPANSPAYNYLVVAAAVVLVVTPVGSNNGLFNSVYGYWLALPLCLARLFEIGAVTLAGRDFGSRQILSLVKGLAFGALVSVSLWHSSQFSYRDDNRSSAWGTVDSPKLRGIFMGRELARDLSALLKESPKYVKQGDFVLAYNEIPGYHYLTDTIPYMYSSWPRGLADPDKRRLLEKAQSQRQGGLPVAVRRVMDDKARKRHIPIEEFIVAKGYKVAWKNEAFEILLPPQIAQPSTN
ncbi:MAG: hypothetical protein K1X53_03820, partial [Candidatus Sumerlaeaceae bacterium]|nr:hypothetical protein [Candidatus Sumerlaeaceae bacterium]